MSAPPGPALGVMAGCRETCLSPAQLSWVSAGLTEQKQMACKALQVSVGGEMTPSGLGQCGSVSL